MRNAEGLGLLLEIEQVDVHGVEAEGQGEFDQFAGTPRQGQADRAEVPKHAGKAPPKGLRVGMRRADEYD